MKMKKKQKSARFIAPRATKKNWAPDDNIGSWDYGRNLMLPCYVEMAVHTNFIPPQGCMTKEAASAYRFRMVETGCMYHNSPFGEHLLKAGEAILLEPGTPEEMRIAGDEQARTVTFGFAGSLVSSLLESLHLQTNTVICGLPVEKIVSLIDRLIVFLKRKDESESEKTGAFLMELLYIISSGEMKHPHALDLTVLIRFLESAIPLEEPLKFMMERTGLSRSQLERMMRRFFGEPPMRTLIRRRFEKASELLRTTQLPVKEIAALVGYHPASRFSSCFHKQFGISPLAYRRRKGKIQTAALQGRENF